MIFDLLPAVILGSLLGMDVVSVAQTMVSRPIVAATVAGALAGNALGGLLIGATLELIALETLPVGASRYPEWGSASVVGGTLYVSAGGNRPDVLALTVLCALATAWVGAWSMYLLRRLNGAWAHKRKVDLEAGRLSAVVSLQALGVLGDLVRAGTVTLGALLLFVPAMRNLLARWQPDSGISLVVAAGVALAVASSAVWKHVHGTRGARWLMLGSLAVGAVVVLA